jgi:hypothetical protein
MTSYHLTWLLYNKYLYEKSVYMDRNIQDSLSSMIDLLQPSNDEHNEDSDLNAYSPAEYTRLLNRFLAFDEEMSEIDCLYKDCRRKMNLKSDTKHSSSIRVQSNKMNSSQDLERIVTSSTHLLR